MSVHSETPSPKRQRGRGGRLHGPPRPRWPFIPHREFFGRLKAYYVSPGFSMRCKLRVIFLSIFSRLRNLGNLEETITRVRNVRLALRARRPAVAHSSPVDQ